VIGIVTSWLAAQRQGQDFGVLYAAARGIATGAPIYNSEWQRVAFSDWGLPPVKNVPYPPSSGFVALPFAAFPFHLAQALWFLLMTATVVLGVRALVRLVSPQASTGAWLLVAGAILLSACIRWGMTPLQGAPLVFGLLALMVAALYQNRPSAVFFIAASVLALKFTVALPFLALLVLHRRYKTLLGVFILVGLLNIVGFARVGGLAAIEDFRNGLQMHEAFGTVDTPDPWDPQSVPRLDWPYLLYGLFGSLGTARVLSSIAFCVTCVWLALVWRKLKEPVSVDVTATFLAPIVLANFLLLYHHHYDISPILVPLVVFLFQTRSVPRFRDRVAWFWMLPLAVMIAFAPIAVGRSAAVRFLGEPGVGITNLLFPITCTMMLIGSLIFVRRLEAELAMESSEQREQPQCNT
jgi:hypothetical protein